MGEPTFQRFRKESLPKYWVIGSNLKQHSGDVVPQAEFDGNELPMDFRPARMGVIGRNFNEAQEVAPTQQELIEAFKVVRSIDAIARFGQQAPAFSIVRSANSDANQLGEFSGIVFPGTMTSTFDIASSQKSIISKYGETIKANLGDLDFLNWFTGKFHLYEDGKFSYTLDPSSQRITIFSKNVKDLASKTSVLGMPAMDTESRGYPPFIDATGRPSMHLMYISFSSSEAKFSFENMIKTSKTPLRAMNAILSVIFSPDLLRNLSSVANTEGLQRVLIDGKLNGIYYKNIDEYCTDIAGLGFDLISSTRKYGEQPPKII